MNNLNKYIDRCLIDEYADKDFNRGYSFDIENVSEHDQLNFLDFLFRNDQITRSIMLDHMQEIVEERLNFVEAQEKFDSGLKPIIDQANGEVTWIDIEGVA